MVNIALHISLKNFEQQCNGRAYPAIIPTAHVIAPYHCFQLFCRVIRTSSATTVKQLVLHSCNQPTNTFAAGVVMTSAFDAVHALPDIKLVQRTSVKLAGVLTSSVGMEYSTIKIRIRCCRIFDCRCA